MTEALRLADLAGQLATARADNEKLKAQVAAGQDELRSCLVRAQQPAVAPVWGNQAGVGNGR